MAKVKLALDELTDEALLTLMGCISKCLRNNPNFSTTTPTLAEIDAATDEGRAAIVEAMKARDVARAKTTIKNQTMARLRGMASQLGDSVQYQSAGDPVKILSAGMGVRQKASPVGPPDPPEFVDIKNGASEGELLLKWKNPKHARTCTVQLVESDPALQSRILGSASKGRFTVSGLTPGVLYTFRVGGVGSAGPGPWSNPVSRKAM